MLMINKRSVRTNAQCKNSYNFETIFVHTLSLRQKTEKVHMKALSFANQILSKKQPQTQQSGGTNDGGYIWVG